MYKQLILEINCRLSFLKTAVSSLYYNRETYLRLYKILFSFYIMSNYLKSLKHKQKTFSLRELLINVLIVLYCQILRLKTAVIIINAQKVLTVSIAVYILLSVDYKSSFIHRYALNLIRNSLLLSLYLKIYISKIIS